MALRIFQLGIVFAIGFHCGPVFGALETTSNLTLSLELHNPHDVIVIKGQSATLRCDAHSTWPKSAPKERLVWFYNGNPLPPNDTRRIIQSDKSLYIPKVSIAKRNITGEYSCLVTNQVGSLLSNTAKLRVASIDRDFQKQPSNVTIKEFRPVLLECSIHSVPTAEIQWEFNNLPLPQSTRFVPLPSGALLIFNSQLSDSGSYRCVATNTLIKKSKSSAAAELAVLPTMNHEYEALAFLPLYKSPNVTVLLGDELTLYCAVIGWPIPTVQWLNNLSLVVSNSSRLSIRQMRLHDAGNYTCVGRNAQHTIKQTFLINVHQRPYFNITPSSQKYPSSRTARLECQALGVPEPRIYWLKNGGPLPKDPRIKKYATSLVLSHTYMKDSGLYQCVAVNAAGKIWTAAEILIFSEVSNAPENVQCRPFDETTICLTWEAPKNVTPIAYTSFPYYTDADRQVVDGANLLTNQTYQLAGDLTPAINYTFSVRFYTTKAASNESNRVTCQTGAPELRNLQIESLTETSVLLKYASTSWDIPCGGTEKNKSYTVEWRRAGAPKKKVMFTEKNSYTINGLLPGVGYEFRVYSRSYENDLAIWMYYKLAGEEDELHNDSLNVTEELPNAPEEFNATSVFATSVKLAWLNTKPASQFYTVCYVEVKEKKECKNGVTISSTSNSIEIEKLKQKTKYEFRVKGHNANDIPGPYSESITVITQQDVPSPVQRLEYKIINETTLCLRWYIPVQPNGRLQKYVISYTPDRDRPIESWLEFSVPSHPKKAKCWPGADQQVSALVANLQPDQYFTVLVRAVSDVGIGKPTVLLDVSTNKNQNKENDSSLVDANQSDLVGISVGVSLAFLCIVFCVICILLRRRCLKRRALTRARMAASNNYYPAVAHYATNGSSVQVRLDGSTVAEVPGETEHLVAEHHQTHIPPVYPSHLDTKGGGQFSNGSIKPFNFNNGGPANGHVHITENPQYYAFEENNGSKGQFEGDSNSNFKPSKFYDLHRLFENSKKSTKPSGNNYQNCSPHFDDCNKMNDSIESVESIANSFNLTNLTCLDDSLSSNKSVMNHTRRISPILGPNG